MISIIVSDEFKKRIKPLLKKYHTLQDSVTKLGERLIKNPLSGDAYGNSIYKIRLADESKGKGSRGGFRVLYYYKDENEVILFITIYDKNELDTIKKRDAVNLLKKVLEKLGR